MIYPKYEVHIRGEDGRVLSRKVVPGATLNEAVENGKYLLVGRRVDPDSPTTVLTPGFLRYEEGWFRGKLQDGKDIQFRMHRVNGLDGIG